MSSSDMKSDTSKSGGMKSHRSARGGGANTDQVKAAQEALKDKGMDPGSADGVMGPKTRQALREFQKKEGLKESGQLDAETMDKLGVQKTSRMDSGSGSGSMGSSSGSGSPSSSPSASPSAQPSSPSSPSTGAGGTQSGSSGSSSGASK
jgi:peptidoglycan hydrolase-like protein with peptidoglycan-binding domain